MFNLVSWKQDARNQKLTKEKINKTKNNQIDILEEAEDGSES